MERTRIQERYTTSVNRFVEREIADQVARYEDQIRNRGEQPRIVNKLGVLYARYGLLGKAKEQFEKAARGQYAPAMVNLGNILFLAKQYEDALEVFTQAKQQDPDLAARFSYLVSATDEAARASSAMIAETVVWDEEE